MAARYVAGCNEGPFSDETPAAESGSLLKRAGYARDHLPP